MSLSTAFVDKNKISKATSEVESYLLKINLRVILNFFNISCRVYLRLLMQSRPIIKENNASVLAAH